MSKILILLVFISSLLNGSMNDAFNKEIEEKLSGDLNNTGIAYDKETNTIKFTRLDLVFSRDISELSATFKDVFRSFYPSYVDILLDYKDNIDQVLVKGHTSSENSRAEKLEDKYMKNLVLSQKRADNILKFMKVLTEDRVGLDKEWLDKNIKAVGLSSSQLVYDQNGTEDRKASRRVDIEVIFKKEEPIIAQKEEEVTNNDGPQRVIYLADYVRRLLVENPTLAEKYSFLKSIQKDIDIANSAYKPTVALNFRHAQYTQSTPDDYSDIQSADITLRYNIFNGFKDAIQKNISKQNYTSNRHLKDQLESDVIFALTEAFISIKKQREILQLAAKNLKDYDRWLEKEEIKFQNGLVSLKDFAKVQARDTTQRMNYEELNREYRDNISMFQRYLDFLEEDIPFFEDLKPYSKYFRNKDIAYHDTKRLSPYLKEADSIVLLYKQRTKKEKPNFYPIVDLVAKKSIQDENFEVASTKTTRETYVALEARIDLYSAGKESSNYEKSLLEYKQKVKKRDEIARDVKYKVDLSFNKFDLVKTKNELLENLISKREDSLLGATYDYKFAKIDANALLDTVDDLYNAKREYINNKYDLLTSKYMILSNVGVLKNYILEDWAKEE